ISVLPWPPSSNLLPYTTLFRSTSLPQVGAVSESCEQRRDINRQLPLPVSKKSERRKGSRIIQASNQASIDGLIVSSRSNAKLSRSEEHTSELQSPDHIVCRLLL